MYDFENKDKIPFNELAGDQMKFVVGSDISLIQWHDASEGWILKLDSEFYVESIYRVKPVPYTLEDALKDMRIHSEEASVFHHDDMVVPVSEVSVFIEKLAESLGAKS